jgi:F0F1-type ATP synthase delta subunit
VAHEEKPPLRLPDAVISPGDINRLIRELQNINDALLQLKLRDPSSKVKFPASSHMMDTLASDNKLNLIHEADRIALSHFLLSIKSRAPVLQISFAVEPGAAFLGKLLQWLRREINPAVLLTIGLQPTIGAGCVLRTTNHVWDLSLQQAFSNQRSLLIKKLIPGGGQQP